MNIDTNDPLKPFFETHNTADRDVSEDFIFKRGMLMDWARYERGFAEQTKDAILAAEPSKYIKHSARAGLFRQLAERQEVLCKALMLPAEIQIGLLYSMMELERQAEQEKPADE